MSNSFMSIKFYLQPDKLLTAGILVLFSYLTVNKYSPEFLHTDVLINSVMSLQNITLFYWEQSRLINVLPLLANVFRDPESNLYFVLLFTAFTHYSLLFLFAKVGTAVAVKNKGKFNELAVFSVISLIFLVSFKGETIFSIVVGHIEYSLPALIVGLVFWSSINRVNGFDFWLCLSTFFLFIAIGMNYSAIILCFTLAGAFVIYTRKITRRVVLFFVFSIISFIVWMITSYWFGTVAVYSKFYLEFLSKGVTHFLIKTVGSINICEVFLFAYFFLYLTYQQV